MFMPIFITDFDK